MDAPTLARGVALSRAAENAGDLQREFRWLSEVIGARVRRYFGKEKDAPSIAEIQPPALEKGSSLFADFIAHYNFGFAERAVLALALAPFAKPELLDVFFQKNKATERGFTEFGGQKGTTHGGFLPTGETVLFLLAGSDLTARFELQKLFERDHVFARHNILKLEPAAAGEPFLSGALKISREILDYLTTGEVHKPDFSTDFPARLLQTQMEWDDLILEKSVLGQIDELRIWLKHGQTLADDWGLAKKLRPGYRALFHGPPGTGKTLTATLLGKATSRDVYRIDLSAVVSKYIGETEKNLAKVFDRAENKGWILFFDEADALFGKRTEMKDAVGKYANQEVSFLLQRIEIFDGIILLASNRKGNLDEAFIRRFESIIHFPMPSKRERERLWREGFSKKSRLEKSVDIPAIAEKYEMSGGAILNVVRCASLMALERGEEIIRQADVLDGVRKEFLKEGKTV